MSDKEAQEIRKDELKVAIYELRELVRLNPRSQTIPGLHVAIEAIKTQIREINRER